MEVKFDKFWVDVGSTKLRPTLGTGTNSILKTFNVATKTHNSNTHPFELGQEMLPWSQESAGHALHSLNPYLGQSCMIDACSASICDPVTNPCAHAQETQRPGLLASLTAQCRPLAGLRFSRNLRSSRSSTLTATWQCLLSHP